MDIATAAARDGRSRRCARRPSVRQASWNEVIVMMGEMPYSGSGARERKVTHLTLHKETVRHLGAGPPSEALGQTGGHTRNQTCTCQPLIGMPGAWRGPTGAKRRSAVCT
jgi:hypothetical protein